MNSTANRFLQFAAFFAPDLPLPMDVLAELVNNPQQELEENLSHQDLITRLPVGCLLNIQPENLPKTTPENAQQTINAVVERLEKALRNHNKVKQLAAFQTIGPHLITLIETLSLFNLKNLWQLHSLMARYLVLVGKINQACAYFEQAFALYPQPHRAQDEALHELMLQYAEAETTCKNFTFAAELVEQVIANENEAEGQARSSTTVQLAHIAYRSDDYSTAIELYKQAIDLEQESSGDINLIASHWNNLGRIYLSADDVENAILSFSTALNYWKDTASTEHHINQALALKNLALAFQQQEDFPQAQTAIEGAIRLSEEEYGADHPDIGRDANIYALVLQAQGHYESALEQFRRALRIDTHSFGQWHPEIALTLNNMGTLYAEMGQLDKARQSFLDARGILRQCATETHPYWQQVEENIAALGE